MIPPAVITLLFTGVAGALGNVQGKQQDAFNKKQIDVVNAQYNLIDTYAVIR